MGARIVSIRQLQAAYSAGNNNVNSSAFRFYAQIYSKSRRVELFYKSMQTVCIAIADSAVPARGYASVHVKSMGRTVANIIKNP